MDKKKPSAIGAGGDEGESDFEPNIQFKIK